MSERSTDSDEDPMQPALDRLASEHGIDPMRPSPDGKGVAVSDDSKRKLLRALDVPIDTSAPDPTPLPRSNGLDTPSRCFLPAFLRTERVWGVSL